MNKKVIKPDEAWEKALNEQAEADWAEYVKKHPELFSSADCDDSSQ